MLSGLDLPITQGLFGQAVGISHQRVSQLVADGVLQPDATACEWILAYVARLHEQAAERGPVLTIERTALARSQRIGQDLKNAQTQAEFAPVSLLNDVLAVVAAAVATHIEALPAAVRASCPDLKEHHLLHVDACIASALSEWRRCTSSLDARVLQLPDEGGDDTDAPPSAHDTFSDADVALLAGLTPLERSPDEE